MRACLTGNSNLLIVAGITSLVFVCSQFWVFKYYTRRRSMKGNDVDIEAEKRKYAISPLPDDHTEAEKWEDRISELPDDVIALIISRLYTRDAVRTSALSKRWRHVYTFITEVRFSCYLMPKARSHGDHAQMEFMEGVDTFLRHYSASKMKSFRIVCCFAGYYLDIFGKLMSSIARLGVEQLIIEMCCSSQFPSRNPIVFSSNFLPEASPVNRMCLWDSSLHTRNQSCLKYLELIHVAFTSEEVECILSNSSSLESLKLIYCMLPSKLRIHGPDLQLKSLVLHRCSELSEIDLSAVNLITFEIRHWIELKLSYSYVPLLQNLFIEFKDCNVTHVFGEAATLPRLECMSFIANAMCFEGNVMGRVINKLSNLRHLVLMLMPMNSLNLLSLAPILDLCPLLHKFHLSLGDEKVAEKRVSTCETGLREVELSGYCGSKNEYDFLLYILRNVASLKKLTIFLDVRYYKSSDRSLYRAPTGNLMTDEERRQSVRRKLQGQAISQDVDIVITAK